MPELHTLLVNLDILKVGLSIDDLALRAAMLLKSHPPATLTSPPRGRPPPPRRCAAIEAKIIDGAWWVPESTVPARGSLTNAAIDWVLRLPISLGRDRTMTAFRIITSTGALVASAALMLAMTRLQSSEG